MIRLTADEQKKYTEIITKVIPKLSPGKYGAKDFFGTDPVCPRIVRRLYEDVESGIVQRTSLAGTRSVDGYVVL